MKKIIIIIVSVALGLAIIAGAVSGILYYRSFTRLFGKTDFPVAYKANSGNIIVIIKDKSGSKTEWMPVVAEEGYVSIEAKGKPKSSKAKYIISPSSKGITTVYFIKSINLGKISVAESLISLNVYVSDDEETGVLRCDLIDNVNLSTGGTVIGADTAYPVALSGYAPVQEDDYYFDELATGTDPAEAVLHGNIDFINGMGDWTVEADTDDVALRNIDRGDRAYTYIMYIGSYDTIPDSDEDIDDNGDNTITDAMQSVERNTATDATEEIGSCELTFSSASLGISVKKKVTFYRDGHMIFTPVEEKK